MRQKILRGLSAAFVPIGIIASLGSFLSGNSTAALFMGLATGVNFYFAYIQEEPKE